MEKKDFKRIRTTVTKILKDLDSTKVRVEELSAFVDKVEYELHDEVSINCKQDENELGWKYD